MSPRPFGPHPGTLLAINVPATLLVSPCGSLRRPVPPCAPPGSGDSPQGLTVPQTPPTPDEGLRGLGTPHERGRVPEGDQTCHRLPAGHARDPPTPCLPPKKLPLCGLGPGVSGGGSRAPGRVPQPPGGDKRGRGGWRWGTRMPSSWVLVLAVLGGACALPAPAPLAYTQALAQAVDSFNQRPEVQNVFRLLSADPEPNPDVQLSSLQRLNFTIMETRCSVRSGARPDSCEFKDDGVIKDCSAPVPVPQRGGHPVLDITCVDSTVDPVRVKRFWPLLRVAIKTVATAINIFKAIKGK
ncbi:cathelicidin-3-like [Phalacrocorax aristotelis]|uniref:cathelicidin-3-like n=1 Tax=Phalacrocorax aristotelis TaxID=126867 RepID=UPI003F4B06A9